MTGDYYQVQREQQEEEFTDPYSMFLYAIRSPYTKESYFRRLRRFFDIINFCEGETLDKRCNAFAYSGRTDTNWAFSNILRFLQSQKERVEKKEITASTLRNYFKTIKMFCEVTEISIQWKKIARGLPRGKRYADDRAPTLDEIHKIIEYPDRRIKPIVYTMASSGMSLAYIPVLTAAISNARREQSGLASGLVNTSYQIGSALGLAVIVAVASSQTATFEKIGLSSLEALNGGFHTAFIVGAIISVTATLIAVIGLKMRTEQKIA